MKCSARHASYLCVALIRLISIFSHVAHSAEVNPLQPVDTSSPRATLQGFAGTMDGIYLGMKEFLQDYEASRSLYPSPGERRKQFEVLSTAPKAIRVLDLSDIPPVLHDTAGAERALQLKEILDRIEWPPFEAIPDREAMARASSKRWRLPGTEIDIALVEAGPRAGEYLVSAASVDRLPEFYERVKKLPYKPGAAAELSDAYRLVSSGGATTIYDAYLSSPVGLEFIVPIRWMLTLPALGQCADRRPRILAMARPRRRPRRLPRPHPLGEPPSWLSCRSQDRGAGARMACSPDAARHHLRMRISAAPAPADPADRRRAARHRHLPSDRCALRQRRLAFHDRRQPPRRRLRVLGASAATQPGQPAHQARHALHRHRDCHRNPDPRSLRAGLPRLFGAGRARASAAWPWRSRPGTASRTSSARY